MVKQYKLNIRQALAAIDQRNGGWLAEQSAEARRDFVPFTALRWTVAVPDLAMEFYLLMANERVNVQMGKLQQHPDLIFRLLASCGCDVVLEHNWLTGPSGRQTLDKARAFLTEMHPDCNDDEITTLLGLHSAESFKLLMDECGVQSNDGKAILAAFTGQSEKPEIKKTSRGLRSKVV